MAVAAALGQRRRGAQSGGVDVVLFWKSPFVFYIYNATPRILRVVFL